MRWSTQRILIGTLTMALFAANPVAAEDLSASGQLVQNPQFASDAQGDVADWAIAGFARERITIHSEDGTRMLRVSNPEPGTTAATQQIPVDPADGAVDIRVRMRAVDLVPGDPKWTGARFALEFRNAEGRRTGAWPASPRLREDTDGWQSFELREQIPQDASQLFLQIGLWQSSGTVDFAEPSIQVVPDFEPPTRVEPVVEGEVPIDTRSQEIWSSREIPAARPVTGAELDESVVATVLHVAADDSASDDYAGTDAAQPLATLGHALTLAQRQLDQGLAVRIALGPGTYRESALQLENVSDRAQQTLLVIAGSAPGAVVIASSSVRKDWEALGDGVFAAEFATPLRRLDSAWGQTEPILLRREMVFIDGLRQTQVLDRQALRPGTFFMDDAAGRLLIHPDGVDPRQALVEVADADVPPNRSILDLGDKPNLVLRNLVFRHGNQGLHNQFAVRATGNLLVEHCRFEHNNSGGLGLNSAENVTLRHCQLSHNGGLGLFGWRIRNLLVQHTETSHNNWRGFAGDYTAWSIGGIKLHWIEQVRLENHRAVGNLCPGFWVDLWCYHVQVVDSVFEDHALEAAILLELTQHVVIENTQIIRNAEGIRIHDAADILVENSRLVGNAVSVMVYGSKPRLQGAPASVRGGVAGLFIPTTGLAIRGSHVEAEDRPEWQIQTETIISSFLQYVSLGYPPFFHVNSYEQARTFFSTLNIEDVHWVHPLGERPFRGPSHEMLSESEFEAAIAGGWERSGEWREAVDDDGARRFAVRLDDPVHPLEGFSYYAIVRPYIQTLEEGQTRFVRIEHPFLRSRQALFTEIALPAGAKRTVVSALLRVDQITPGDKPWQVPRFVIHGTSDDGARIGGAVERRMSSSGEWVPVTLDLDLAERASGLRVEFVTHHTGVRWDIQDVEVRIE
jgi:hypothetical protein